MFKRFVDVEVGEVFRTQEGGEYQKLPPVRPDGFMWLFANTLNLQSRRFAFFGDHELVKVNGREPLDIQDGVLRIDTAEGLEMLQVGA